MYNQTVRDIDLVYQQLDVMYENLNNIRNIINVVTGVSDSMNSTTTTTEQETNPFTFGTFARPSNHSYYNTGNNSNLSLSSRLYLVDFARYLLDSYDNETAETTNNRETEERAIPLLEVYNKSAIDGLSPSKWQTTLYTALQPKYISTNTNTSTTNDSLETTEMEQ
jgi:hypothetical protein